ncbi:hypothetical protein SAMN05421837_108369 [Amycolatopsis pretoriensis]|uniref:Uncharacterized protein n=1 Tax=Amycolatopsis pretoriensis TaxID=218821 RepID=A0A1H5RCI5_9PSEU|nr:hypothetical protein [Amycolatopsis pretoriensis]SEF35774.1 hypothetical protein SAMN05421837_108369 [Amycolatopsis pretoriensis]
MTRLRVLLCGALAATAITGPFEVPAALASTSDTLAAAAVADPAATARKLVRRLAGKDPRAAVRADAWVAWADENDDVVYEFLDFGLAAAEQRAAETASADADFCRRVVLTYTVAYAPEVNAAAQRALLGTDSDRELFVRSGFAAAEQRDRLAREADGSQQEALVEADRQYVRTLAAHDPGTQVRAAAAWATRSAATDADLVEFFAYGWATGAELDLEAHRLRDAEQEARWLATVRRLLTDAQEAERAALEASGEIEVQLREAAARAWQRVGEQTGAPRVAWADAAQVARDQAANWAAVAAAAQATTGPNWQAVRDAADPTRAAWAAEQDWAAEQASFWNALLADAVDGETRMRNPQFATIR